MVTLAQPVRCKVQSSKQYNKNNTPAYLPNLNVGCSCGKKNTWCDALSIAYRENLLFQRLHVGLKLLRILQVPAHAIPSFSRI
jgi:hypothetical protein